MGCEAILLAALDRSLVARVLMIVDVQQPRLSSPTNTCTEFVAVCVVMLSIYVAFWQHYEKLRSLLVTFNCM